jgi:hypothetical protein
VSDSGGISQVRAARYLAVNVYPKSDGWRLAVLVREPGRPYPRLVGRVCDVLLDDGGEGLPGALQAASRHLSDLSRDLASTPAP